MHIFITTLGTRGDVEPYLALGIGLKAAGHRVTLSTAARFGPDAEALGLDIAATTNGILDLLAQAPIREAIESMTNAVEVIKRARGLIQQFDPIQRTLVDETWAAMQDAAPDLVVYHPKAFWGADQAYRLRIPAVMAPLQPVVVPTGERPAMGFPSLPLGPVYRRGTHELLLALSKWGTGRLLTDWRQAHDAPTRPSMLQMPDGAPISVVHAFSGHVVPTPSDWPPHVIASGYWARDAPDWTPPADLAAFLDAGPPPVYVGFGSMASHTPERTTRIVVDALARAGVRGLVATGWGGLEGEALPDGVFAIDAAPHAALFPQCAAVVHHGGAGTTAAGLTAGRPTVICPFFADQPYWGARVAALGVGPAPISQRRLTVDGLAGAIREATTDETMRGRVHAIGEALRSEDGVGTAVAFIERVGA